VPSRPALVCFSIGGAYFVAATLLSDVFARVAIGGEGVGHAIAQHLYYAAIGPIGTGMLLAPFLLFSWMAASLARRKSMRQGLALLCIFSTILAVIYFWGYQESQLYMTKRMWTAAALSVGFLMFKSIPVLVVCLVAFLIMRRVAASSPNTSLERTRKRKSDNS
jgi:hypothetical protein